MALPAYRVVGHKEYGNTPPGGWPGRKTDPTYSMNWRRDRVAAFRPRSTSEEDDMSAAAEKQIAEIHAAVGANGIGDVVTNPKDVSKRREVSLAYLAAYARADANTAVRMLARSQSQVAGLTAAVQALAEQGDGVDLAQILARIDAAAQEAAESLREVLAEGYDVRLERKTDDAPAS